MTVRVGIEAGLVEAAQTVRMWDMESLSGGSLVDEQYLVSTTHLVATNGSSVLHIALWRRSCVTCDVLRRRRRIAPGISCRCRNTFWPEHSGLAVSLLLLLLERYSFGL